MRSYFIFLLTFFILAPLIFPRKVVLEDIFNPDAIIVEQGRIFITQGVKVFIYHKSDQKLATSFGKPGEGPQEFKKSPAPWIPSLTIYPRKNDLVINSIGKVSFYSQDGKFLNETKTKPNSRYIPVGDQFVRMYFLNENKIDYIVADLMDDKFSRIKEISRFTFPAQDGKKRDPVLMARMATLFDRFSYGDKFVFVTEGNSLQVFDESGKELTSFKPDYSRVEVNDLVKKELDQFFTNNVFLKVPYLADKSRNLIKLPDQMPLFKDYRLADGKIYVFSNFKTQGKYETFIYDFKGKLLSKTFSALVDKDILSVFPFTINNGKIYQLVWDEDREECLLEITQI